MEIRAFVAEHDPEQLATAAGDIAGYPEVLDAKMVTQEQALGARKELGDFRDVFEGATLPRRSTCGSSQLQRDPATVKRVASRVRAFSFIDDVRYGEVDRETVSVAEHRRHRWSGARPFVRSCR